MVSEPHWKEVESFTCPKCLMVSFNPNDVDNLYCGNCHKYVEDKDGEIANTHSNDSTTD